MIVFERRACAIIYNLLKTLDDPRPWLLPANVCTSVPATFLEAGQPFELIDISESSCAIDVDACSAHLKSRTGGFGGIVFVRAYGSEREPTSAFQILKTIQPDLFILDDKCLCRPNAGEETVSSAADATLFSTGKAKFTDLGHGGFAHLHPATTYRRHEVPFDAHALEEVERRCKEAVAATRAFTGNVSGWLDLRPPEMTWNDYRLRMNAASQIAADHKRSLNAIYERALPRDIQFEGGLQNWRFNIRVNEPDRLVASIFDAGLFASRHYAPLGGVFGSGTFPGAAAVHARVVNLFNDLHFDEARARKTCEVVLRHLDGVDDARLNR